MTLVTGNGIDLRFSEGLDPKARKKKSFESFAWPRLKRSGRGLRKQNGHWATVVCGTVGRVQDHAFPVHGHIYETHHKLHNDQN